MIESHSETHLAMSPSSYGSVVIRRISKFVAFASGGGTRRVTNLIRCGLKMPSRALLAVSLLFPLFTGVCYSQCSCNPTGSPPYGGASQCYSWDYQTCSWIRWVMSAESHHYRYEWPRLSSHLSDGGSDV